MRAVLKYAWRAILAGLILAAVSYISFRMLEVYGDFPRTTVSRGFSLGVLTLRGILIAGVLAYPVVRSRWSGTQLMCAIFVAYFGIHTFVNVSQAIVLAPTFMTPLRAAVMAAHGFVKAVCLSVLLVILMGKLRQEEFLLESPRLHLPAGEWLWKMGVGVVLYVVLSLAVFFVVKPFVGSFWRDVGEVPLWQRIVAEVGRGLLVGVFVLPVIKMMRGERLETALVVAFLVGIIGGVAPLLVPVAFMKGSVRFVLIAGVGLANWLYGFVTGYLMSRAPREG